jgi:hypothetical protein
MSQTTEPGTEVLPGAHWFKHYLLKELSEEIIASKVDRLRLTERELGRYRPGH